MAEGVSLELLSLSLGLLLFQPCSLLSLSKRFKDHQFSLSKYALCAYYVPDYFKHLGYQLTMDRSSVHLKFHSNR